MFLKIKLDIWYKWILQVEDDAILMAIQSHGLQSGWRGPNNPAVASSSHSSETYTEPLCKCCDKVIHCD